jgi:hypothetical protein
MEKRRERTIGTNISKINLRNCFWAQLGDELCLDCQGLLETVVRLDHGLLMGWLNECLFEL